MMDALRASFTPGWNKIPVRCSGDYGGPRRRGLKKIVDRCNQKKWMIAMGKTFIRFTCCLLLLCMRFGQPETLQAQTLMIDTFDKEPANTSKKYPKFIGIQLGYDIYYVKADVQLSFVRVSPRRKSCKALRIEFNLPPFFSWGNWASVRSEFQSPMNLENYK